MSDEDDFPTPPKSVYLEKIQKRGRGRPRKIDLLPADPEVKEIMKKKAQHIKSDDLSNKIEDNPNSLDVLDQLMLDLANEAASLHFERQEAERQGKETSVLSSKKVTALKSVADIYFKKRNTLLEEAFDFESQRFQKFIEWLLVKIVRKSAEEVLSSEEINILFDKIGEKFENNDWQQDAMSYVKSD